MPRFYFPIIDGTRLDDPTGVEVPDVEAARRHAQLIATHMLTHHRRHVIVVDEDGNELHRVSVG